MKLDLQINKPFKFKVFATTVNVVWENKRMNDKGQYGECDYSQSKITLSTSNGVDELSIDKIKDTFYHERVHMILDSMHEYELSKNERFVDQLAKLWRQTDETLEF